MKLARSFLAGLVFVGGLGVLNNALAEDGILSKEQFTADTYCHMKFPAIQPSTLGDAQPVLKNSSTGDVIDFYGSCDESPLGQDQIQTQKVENEHRFEMEFSD